MATKERRLWGLGMTYQEYLLSPLWAEAKRRFRESNLPQDCMACGNPKVEYHHRSYQRIGRELPTDLIPLCRDCHHAIHKHQWATGRLVKDTHVLLRQVFGWTKAETRRRFRPWALPGQEDGFAMKPRLGGKENALYMLRTIKPRRPGR